jgi:hypothetical protein
MTRHAVMFSGGITSWAAGKRIAEQHGAEGLVLLFADTQIEDEDTYRFLPEAAASIGAPLVTIADGRDPWQVFRDERYLGNTRVDPCSKLLKRELLRRWVEDNCDPADAIIVLGLDWTEGDRLTTNRERWAPWQVAYPLAERPHRAKHYWLDQLRAEGPTHSPSVRTARSTTGSTSCAPKASSRPACTGSASPTTTAAASVSRLARVTSRSCWRPCLSATPTTSAASRSYATTSARTWRSFVTATAARRAR